MSMPINSSLQSIDNEIKQLISEAESGKFNEGNLFKTEYNIQQLLKQKDLPPNVRNNLQGALKELKGAMSEGSVSIENLFKADYKIQQAEGPSPKG